MKEWIFLLFLSACLAMTFYSCQHRTKEVVVVTEHHRQHRMRTREKLAAGAPNATLPPVGNPYISKWHDWARHKDRTQEAIDMTTRLGFHIENKEQEHARFSMLGPVFKDVCTYRSFGAGDDEKRLCFKPEPNCTVFSIGSANAWGFERDIARKTNCQIHTFDCTIVPRVPKDLKDRVTFHKACFGSKDSVDDQGREFLTWPSMLLRAGVAPKYLKCDIEGWEYDAFDSILNSDQQPDQIAAEIHYRGYKFGKEAQVPPLGLFLLGERMMRLGSYVLVDRHDNSRCGHCSEVLFKKV